MSSQERRDSHSSRPLSGTRGRRVSWGPVISQDLPSSSRPPSQGQRDSATSQRINHGRTYHYTGHQPESLRRRDSDPRSGSISGSPVTPTSPYGSGGGYFARHRRSTTTDYLASPLGSPRATRDANTRRGSRSGSTFDESPRASSASSDDEVLWSITFDCAKDDSDTHKMNEYRLWFPYEYSLEDVIDACYFTDKQPKSSWSSGPVDSNGYEVFVLHKKCGDTADGHADCHRPVDPSRFTDLAVSDPDHKYLIRRCVESEYTRDPSAPHIIHYKSKYTLGSKEWLDDCKGDQKENRRQRVAYHHSIAKNAATLRSEQYHLMKTKGADISRHSKDANSHLATLLDELSDLSSSLCDGSNDEKVKKVFGLMEKKLEDAQADIDSWKANGSDFLRSITALETIDYHTGFDVEARQKTIDRLRSERNEAEDELRDLKDRRRRASNA